MLMIIIAFIVGIIFGTFVVALINIKTRARNAGDIVLDFSDPTKDICRLEIATPLEEMATCKKVQFTVRKT